MVLTHHDTSTIRTTYSDVNSPHYIASHTDENNHITSYLRDGHHRIYHITYPDGGSEDFTYNAFGQIKTHQMTSGGTEVFEYDNGNDNRGLKTSSYPPPTPSDLSPQDHPTRYFYYESGPHTDRLRYVVDPRGNATWA